MTEMPWNHGADATACNLAFGHLAGNLKIHLKHQGRVHAETLLAASGAIAGFAAQRSMMARLAAAPDPAVLRQLHIITTAAGHKFLFGDPLNDTLIAKREEESYERVFSLAAGAAVEIGLPPDRLPDQGSFFGHVARDLGGENEGWTSVDVRHRPTLPVKDLLDVVWPFACSILDGRVPGHDETFGVAPQRWRPAITAWCTNVHIRDVASVLDPLTAYTIVVESAIYASKIDAGRIKAVSRAPIDS